MRFLNKIVMVAACTLAGWFETYAWIVDKKGNTIKPKANALQIEVSEAIDWCLKNKRPIRLLLLKPRQKGCSTVSVGALFHFLKLKKLRACIIGGSFDQSSNLLDILKTYANNDSWSVGGTVEVLKDVARWGNGSRCDRQTARNKEAGRSATYQVVLATEVARWASEGVADAKKVLAGLLKTVGDNAGSMVIFETTASGAYGDFYNRWQKGITLDDAKAGKPGFIKIFKPWFVFDDSRRAAKKELIFSVNDLSVEEREYMETWEIDLDQVAWMRWALREECDDDWDTFNEDYPSDEETAFRMSGSARFAKNGLTYQTKLAKSNHPKFFTLQEQDVGQITWEPCSESESVWKRWEEPIDGMSYLVSVDQMTGASQNGGDDPDSHGAKVWRQGYTKVNGEWVPPAIVASLMLYKQKKLYGNWFDIDILTEETYKISELYGKCIIVPEINMDRGMVELLKLKHCNIYKRKVMNKRTNESMDSYGWHTGKTTRQMMIETMAKAVRESPKQEMGEGVTINCEDTISEMKTFVRKESGREEAGAGKHDDQVISAMIGLQCINSATKYKSPQRVRRLPGGIQHRSQNSGAGFGL